MNGHVAMNDGPATAAPVAAKASTPRMEAGIGSAASVFNNCRRVNFMLVLSDVTTDIADFVASFFSIKL